MKVIFQISPTQEYTLAHGTVRITGNHIGPTDIRHSLTSAPQLRPRLGADYVSIKYAGNRQRALGFSVSVQHADLQAAELYAVTYPDTLPKATGDLILETVNSQGNKVKKKYSACAIRNVSIQQSGVSTMITYDIVAGEVQNVSP